MNYTAKLLGYKIDAAHSRVVLWEDAPVLHSDADLERRLSLYRSLESMGSIPSTCRAVGLPDLEAAKAAIRADLELGHDPWDLAVDKAGALARDHFDSPAILMRLLRALPIAKSYDWLRLGDRPDTWLIPSSKGAKVYQVNGCCT
jgi:hypothetical protein